MKRDLVIKAAYFAAIAMGDEPTVRAVQAMCKRICGKALRTADVLRVVTLQKQSGNDPVTPPVLAEAERVTPGQRDGNLHAGVAKVLELEAIEATPRDAGAADALTLPGVRTPPAPERRSDSRPPKLPLDLAETIAAKAIALAVWDELGPYVGDTLTQRAWIGQNMRVARELAQLGHTPEAIVDAWRAASADFGQPLRLLLKVQQHMADRRARARYMPPRSSNAVQNTVMR